MLSQRGVLNLAHNLHDVREGQRRVYANRLNGIDAEWLTPEQAKRFCPILDLSRNARYPVLGATLQRRAGTARHDAVAWGFARAADARGVDIIQECEVTGFDIRDGRVHGVRTTRGDIRAEKVAIVAAGHNSVLCAMAGVRLPLQSHPLQALVSEPIKPILDTVVMSGAVHVYVSQSDKGELVLGAGIDAYNSYAQRGSFHVIESQMGALTELFPIFSRLRMLRTWGGIVDVSPDASPIIGKLPVAGHVSQRRLGHGRLQGHARFRPRVRLDHRQGPTPSAGCALRSGALHHRGARSTSTVPQPSRIEPHG